MEKRPRIPCGRARRLGEGFSSLLVSLKFKIWVGGLRLGGEGKDAKGVSVCISVYE